MHLQAAEAARDVQDEGSLNHCSYIIAVHQHDPLAIQTEEAVSRWQTRRWIQLV